MTPALAFFSRNHVTGAAFTAAASDTYVFSSAGEGTEALQTPTSFQPSTYVRMRSVTWTSWKDTEASGYARISSAYPGDVLTGGSAWARMRLDCPTRQGDRTYFGRYTLEWLTAPPSSGLDGWERGESVSPFPGTCAD